MPFLRLRQICLVAHELEPVVDDLRAVLGLQVCHRDPGVARFGLHNALMRIGSNFIEVVAPLAGPQGEGTAATRHLQRLGGDGGYMVILDCGDIAPWRAHVGALGVRVAALLETPGYTGLQLHPRDTGGALLEINHTPGGESLDGPYWPAGPHWQDAPGGAQTSAQTLALTGAALSASDPARLAARWAQILKRELAPDGPGWQIALDNAATLHFLPIQDGGRAGLSRLDVQVADVAQVLANARLRGCLVTADGVAIGGVTWQLSPAPA